MTSPSLVPGALFANDYQIIRELDRGGMGVVYEAEQRSVGRRRAIKVILPDVARSQKYREYFLREARVGSSIDSDHVVEVTAAGYDDTIGSLWLAMEFLRGETLAARVASRGPLTPAELLACYRQLGHALTAAHRVGVVHCDLKPENVFLCESRRSDAEAMVKVLDFGIAKVVQEYRTSVIATAVEGSPRWMAPEQATRGGRIKPATDVWALGLIAFQLLTGTHYWRNAQTPGGVLPLLGEMMTSDLVAASGRARENGYPRPLPEGFDAWFARCVVRDVDRRFNEVSEAIEALQRALGPQHVHRAPLGTGTVALPEGDGEAHALRRSLVEAEASGDLPRAVTFGERLVALAGAGSEDVAHLRRVLLALARASERAGERRAALGWADRAVALEENHAPSRYLRSVFRLRAGDVTGALDDVERAASQSPATSAFEQHRARVLLLAGRHEEAALRWDAQAAADPANAAVRMSAGAAWAAARQWPRAEEALCHAIELGPNVAEAWWRRGVVRGERGDLKGAQSDLDEAVRRAPHWGDAWYARARLARRLGDANSALQDLVRAAECGHALAMIEVREGFTQG